MNKSHLLINEQALQVLPSLAVELGLEEAIALQQVHYWLNNVKNAGRVDENGDKWVYNTYAKWKEDNFPFWSDDKIQRVFLSLEKQGVLISKQLDAKMRDMTKFYRIDYDALCAMDSLKIAPSNTANLHDVKMNQRIPENTYIPSENPEKKTDEERPAYNLPAQAGLDWQIAAGNKIEQEEIDQNKLIQEALNTFESDMQLPGNWQWYAAKPAEEKTRKALREFIVKKYVENPKAFAEYQTWRTQPYASGKMSNTRIKSNPQDFEASWTDFLASNSMYKNKEEKRPVQKTELQKYMENHNAD